jgi:Glycosyltransferase family 87
MTFLETLFLKNLWLRRLVAALLVAYPLFDFVQYATRVPRQRLIDLFVRYVAARLLAAHGAVYSLTAQRGMADQVGGVSYGSAFSNLLSGYTHPVSDTLLDLRYLPFPFPEAKVVYTAETVLLYAAALVLLWLALKPMAPRVLHWLFPTVLFALYLPSRSSLGLGQSDIPIFFLMVVVFWAYSRDHDLLAGIALALAILSKLAPVVFLLYFLWKREWRVFLYTVGVAALVALITLPFVGIDLWIQFSSQIFPALSTGTAYADNQTLPGLISRLMLDPRYAQGLQSAPSVPLVRAVNTAAELLVVGIALYFTRGRLTARRSLRYALEFSTWLTVLLVISPLAWDHYFTWMVLPITVLLDALLNTRWNPTRLAAFSALLVVALWLINTPVQTFLVYPALWQKSPLLYGALILLALLCERIESTRVFAPVLVPTPALVQPVPSLPSE